MAVRPDHYSVEALELREVRPSLGAQIRQF